MAAVTREQESFAGSIDNGGDAQRAAIGRDRRTIMIQNAGDDRLWFEFDDDDDAVPGDVVSVGTGFFLDPGSSYEMRRNDHPEISGALFVAGATTATAFVVRGSYNQ